MPGGRARRERNIGRSRLSGGAWFRASFRVGRGITGGPAVGVKLKRGYKWKQQAAKRFLPGELVLMSLAGNLCVKLNRG